jgi:citrate synthase
LAALSTVYPDARNLHNAEARRHQIVRLIGKVPTIAAYTYRHSVGFPYVYPDNELSYAENLMNMLWKMAEPKYRANAALDVLFIPARGPRTEL